jgi:hypothetical protein
MILVLNLVGAVLNLKHKSGIAISATVIRRSLNAKFTTADIRRGAIFRI